MIFNKRFILWTCMVLNFLFLGVAGIFIATATIDLMGQTSPLWVPILTNILGIILLANYFLGFFGAMEKRLNLLRAYVFIVSAVSLVESIFGIFLLSYKFESPVRNILIGGATNIGLFMVVVSVLKGIAAIFFHHFRRFYATSKIEFLESSTDSQTLIKEDTESVN
ncbi:uncharacterized protein LOC135265515 [Tribolium castaneum]|uniref:Uncharacterized protein n=1 Tax=Tribolium castaneum TaxID=7070 RepID=D6WZB9_TRICA|nr:hypothetical protein TcasGA2_TC011862 [Tribolium castaneum]